MSNEAALRDSKTCFETLIDLPIEEARPTGWACAEEEKPVIGPPDLCACTKTIAYHAL